ncbi:MAG: ABC transporter ATP-binding protein [Acidimicrobiales bacterium]
MPPTSGSTWSQIPQALGKSLALVRAAAPRELRAVVALQVVGAAGLVAELFLLRRLLSTVLAKSSAHDAGRIVPVLIVMALVAAVSALASGLSGERQRLMVELVRRYAIERILAVTTTVELSDFEQADFNDGLMRARQEALIRPFEVVAGLLSVAQSLIAGAGLVITLALLAPVLLPLLLVGVVPTVLIQRRNSRDLHAVDRSLTTNDRMCWYFEDVLSSAAGAKETRTFRLAPFVGGLRAVLAERRVAAYRQLIRRRSKWGAAMSVFGALVFVLGLGLLAGLVLYGDMAPATAAAAAVVVQQLGSLIGSAGVGAGQVYENSLFLNDVHAFIAQAPPEPPATGAPTRPALIRPAEPLRCLRITGLDFIYPGTDRPVLRDISIQIPGGQVVAVVGENGSGKTTLTKVLCGLYRQTAGSILWNEEDAATVDPEAWRGRFAVVFQDFMRYQMSARLNIGVGRYEAQHDLDGIRRAARIANADQFLSSLDEGYETTLSRAYAGGADLSIGQWQRLALARAFFSDAPVLVLDEPTAALDPRVEQELLHRVRALAGEKTVILISHRLSSVRFADNIFVLREGTLVEQGEHHDLVQRGGYYADLFDMQASGYRGS